ncbi:MAG: DHH family phosphoesterase [Clostridia bacterium]|nr:DHH family phosphoesterase [Clostridia bacterium]
MKRFTYKYIVAVVMAVICVALCAFMWQYGFVAVLVSAVASILLIAWSVFSFKLFAGLMYADYKLYRFTKKFKKHLDSASTIYIMGHAFSDLDSVGASYGLYYALRNKYNVKMVANKQNTLARTLVDFLRFSDQDCTIYDYNEIKDTIDKNSLLIVVDTHRPVIMDFKELYDRIDRVIIIDHHRQSEDFVDQTVARYMKSSASSACEIVTLMIRLLGIDKPSTVAATALLSGIMLDTKNFVMNTGPSTFRCAAFLRQNRADPVLIKKMFSESVEVCKRKYDIVSQVELFENFAIAKTKTEDQFTRIATAQAADELLAINGVMASFVMCPSGEDINISARSFGDVDVQKIMAKLGGGGHKTASACQIKSNDFELVEKRLQAAIKNYIV